ncbi:MAG: hypothetical protein H6697_07420 [Myxococcales bacterium]|nr:hypothetical protein [Myxococcales bacterium]MCB9520387.1 hypothetical protein [Myxococcales bacterium]
MSAPAHPPADTDPEAIRAWARAWDRAARALADDERRRAADPERLSRDFLRAVALTRRLIREGVATRPSDLEEHLSWSRLQDAMLARQR